MIFAAALLLLIGAAHFGPEMLAAATTGTVGAWDYVLQGAGAALLWLCVAASSRRWAVRLVAGLGLWESAQRPICRLLLPMGGPPQTGGKTLCEAAIGAPVAWAGLIAALVVALIVQEVRDGGANP